MAQNKVTHLDLPCFLSKDTCRDIDITDQKHIEVLSSIKSQLELILWNADSSKFLSSEIEYLLDRNQFILIQIWMITSTWQYTSQEQEAMKEIVNYYHWLVKKYLTLVSVSLKIANYPNAETLYLKKCSFIIETTIKLKTYLDLISDCLFRIYSDIQKVSPQSNSQAIKWYIHTFWENAPIDNIDTTEREDISSRLIFHYLSLVWDMLKNIQKKSDTLKQLEKVVGYASSSVIDDAFIKLKDQFEATVENFNDGLKVKIEGNYLSSPQHTKVIELMNDINILLLRAVGKPSEVAEKIKKVI